MHKLTGIALAAAVLTLSSCAAGPHQLRRTVGDFDQKLYVEQPWIDVALHIIPVIPLLSFGAAIGDFFLDGYHFWGSDAWDGTGTAFRHYQVTPTDGTLESLLLDDAKLLEIQ